MRAFIGLCLTYDADRFRISAFLQFLHAIEASVSNNT